MNIQNLFRYAQTLALGIISLYLAGCFNLIATAEPPSDSSAIPLLTPSSFGSSKRLYQTIIAEYPEPESDSDDEQNQQTFKAIVDIQRTNLSVVALGPLNRPILQTRWNGEQLKTQMIQALVDIDFSAEQLVRDVQLTFWPCEAWQAALSNSSLRLNCTEAPKRRLLKNLGEIEYQVSYPSPNTVELHNFKNNYKLIIQSAQ